MVNEHNEMMCDLRRKEISYCACGNELKTEQEQDREICRECI